MPQRRALIVEDEQEDQKRIQGLLDSRGIEYTTVDSALAARSKLKESQYLFVILDLDLGTGADEGMFLLDTMLQERIARPTIIISHGGSLPETIALKGRYEFVKETIDKKHLHTLLSVFDRAIKEFPEGVAEGADTASTKRSLWPDLIPLLVAFVVIIGVIAAISQWVSSWVIGIVLIGSLLAFLAIAAFLWRRHDELSEGGLLKVIEGIIKSLPLLNKDRSKMGRNGE
jgi:CheY-like chemotaxis protein